MNVLRNINVILYIALLSLLSQACGDKFAGEPIQSRAGCININVSVPLASSRAGSDDLNEYTVNQLHLYFYQKTGHDDDTSKPVYVVTVDRRFEYSDDIILALPDDALKDYGLFGPESDECYVYAVANVDKSRIVSETVNDIKSTVIGSDFGKTEVQPEFAMDGFAGLSLDRANRIVTGAITLQRAAAKLTLSVDLPQSIDVEEKIVDPVDGSVQMVTTTYYSRAEDMHVWISNGVKQSKLNTPPLPVSEECLYSNEISSAKGAGSGFSFDASQLKYSYTQDIPFYSYPGKWDASLPKGNCFLTLEIPWYYKDGTGNIHNVVTYYRLSVQPGKSVIERNTLYDMRVTIGRLGGITVQKPVDMLFDWNYNMQWNIQTLPTDIKEIRYLLLNNNDFSTVLDAYYYEMENETFISIPYNTSHPVEIESVEMSWYDYKNDAQRSITLTKNSGYQYDSCSDYSPTTDFAGIGLDAEKSTLNLKRDILHIAWNGGPSITGETAINSYTFKIKLRHTGATSNDPSAHATVVISQIPAIYINSQLTSDGSTRFINNNNTTYEIKSGWLNPTYTYKGYVTTGDSWPTNDKKRRYWLGSYHSQSSYVKNKNNYILTISKFAAGDNYIIADPRMRTVDNLNESGTSATAPADWSIAVNNRQLQYYYPADRSDDRLRFIAPQLRVASQWGVTYQISRTGAERRCASYQENGRQAGRWRLPTAAEIEYISGLSNKQYIPYLFGSEGGEASYWCASGGIDVYNSAENPRVEIVETSADERRSVRCVYDEWFWGPDTLTGKKSFTWGDRPRSVSGNKR